MRDLELEVVCNKCERAMIVSEMGNGMPCSCGGTFWAPYNRLTEVFPLEPGCETTQFGCAAGSELHQYSEHSTKDEAEKCLDNGWNYLKLI